VKLLPVAVDSRTQERMGNDTRLYQGIRLRSPNRPRQNAPDR